jgi:bifunctional non-homologous end joining protein LigD
MADAPWPPHFEKQDGEAARVQPSRRRSGSKAPPRPKLPVITIGQAKTKVDALAGLERWRARHPDVVAHLAPEDTLVDAMRGRSSAYYRVRINLKNVPEAARPSAEPLDPDYDPRQEWKGFLEARPRRDPAADE